MRICLPGQWDLLPILSSLGICILILEPLRHAEKINSSKAFILTYVCKALFLVISSNCWVSMVDDCGSGRVQTYTLFEKRHSICQVGGYYGERIQDHYITLFTMLGIWCWLGREEGTRGLLLVVEADVNADFCSEDCSSFINRWPLLP